MYTHPLFRIITIFVTLTIAGVCMIVLAQSASESVVRSTLPFIGSAMFSSALTYLLIEVSRVQSGVEK